MKLELMEKIVELCDQCSEIKEAVEKYAAIKGVSEEEAFERISSRLYDFIGPLKCEGILEVLLDE